MGIVMSFPKEMSRVARGDRLKIDDVRPGMEVVYRDMYGNDHEYKVKGVIIVHGRRMVAVSEDWSRRFFARSLRKKGLTP